MVNFVVLHDHPPYSIEDSSVNPFYNGNHLVAQVRFVGNAADRFRFILQFFYGFYRKG